MIICRVQEDNAKYLSKYAQRYFLVAYMNVR